MVGGTISMLPIIVIAVGVIIVIIIVKAFKKEPNPYALKEQGDLNLKNGNYDQAIKDYSMLIKVKNKGIKIYLDAEKAASNLGREGYESSSSVADCRIVIADALSLRGDAYSKKGDNAQAMSDYNEAILNYDKIIEVYPNSIYAEYQADVYAKKGNRDEAMSAYNKIIWNHSKSIEKNANDFYSLHSRGKLYLKIGNKNQAIADFETILNIELNKSGYEDYDDYTSDMQNLEKYKAEIKEELKTIKQ
jgi:tetratricopeptide (TPR) repeat protein